MPSFHYSAMDTEGQTVTGRIDAADRSEAIVRLAQENVFVTDIAVPRDKAEPGAWRLSISGRRRVNLRVKATMLRQLSTALQAGLPLLSGLRVVEKQAENEALRVLIKDLAEGVQSGQSLSEAMAARPREFSQLEISMVRVGETAGVLDKVMGYLSDFAERDLEIREKIRSAAAYPLFVLGIAGISVLIIITFILPTVIGAVTESVGTMALPLPTVILLKISSLLKSAGWLLAILLVLGILAFRWWLARPQGRLAFDRFKLRIPVLGTAIRRVAVTRFARTLGTLCKSGIQILDALRVLRDTLGNEALARKIDDLAASITQGQSIAEPLAETGEFPPLLIQVIAMGERTGRLDELLLQTADVYEKETSAAIQRVMTVLPAVFIVLMALVVGFILAAVLLPILGMMETM